MQQMAQQPVALLAEADHIVGLDLSDALETAGYRVLGPFATTSESLAALGKDSPTVAVIDITLEDGPCAALAGVLRLRGVPFLVHSAQRPDRSYPVSLQETPWLVKPASAWDVVALCDELSLTSPEPA